MSYRTAWAGGQTTLTDETHALVRLFAEVSERLRQAAEREFRAATSDVG